MPWLETLGWASSGAEVKNIGREREKENLQQENVGQAIQLKRLGAGISGNGQEARKKSSMSKTGDFGDICPNLSGVTFSHEFMLDMHIHIIMPGFTYLHQHPNK